MHFAYVQKIPVVFSVRASEYRLVYDASSNAKHFQSIPRFKINLHLCCLHANGVVELLRFTIQHIMVFSRQAISYSVAALKTCQAVLHPIGRANSRDLLEYDKF